MVTSLKTWGGVLYDLENHLKKAARNAYDAAWQTPAYFDVLHNGLHEEYEAWCEKRGVKPEDRSELRDSIMCHIIANQTPDVLNIHIVCKTLPDGWNVRGIWTSKFTKEQ